MPKAKPNRYATLNLHSRTKQETNQDQTKPHSTIPYHTMPHCTVPYPTIPCLSSLISWTKPLEKDSAVSQSTLVTKIPAPCGHLDSYQVKCYRSKGMWMIAWKLHSKMLGSFEHFKLSIKMLSKRALKWSRKSGAPHPWDPVAGWHPPAVGFPYQTADHFGMVVGGTTTDMTNFIMVLPTTSMSNWISLIGT